MQINRVLYNTLFLFVKYELKNTFCVPAKRGHVFIIEGGKVMWYKGEIFGESSYEIVLWFMVYSIMGWIVESIYMSICNRKLTNRGFAKGPCCPIYGLGALSVFFMLRPFADCPVLLFFVGSIVATTLEYFTAIVMIRIFGEVWWDYNEKPFNYRGIICLESSVAWGFYTVFLFLFLQNFVIFLVSSIPTSMGKIIGSLFLILYGLDFSTSLYRAKKQEKRKAEEEKEEETAWQRY